MRAAVLRTRYPLAGPGAAVSHCKQLFRFTMIGATASDYPRLQGYVKDTLAKADGGDAQAQLVYGMLLGLPQVGRKPQDGLPWFLKAAQSGSRQAQYEVGNGLITGWGCQCDEKKGLVWLRKAAEADEPNAQVTLAEFVLRGTPDVANTRKAVVWLERAAAHRDPYGMLYLSALLAATPVAELRNPQRAVQMIQDVSRVREEPTPLEIRAAAQAASGKFADAVRDQRKAIALATSLGWDLAPLNERLTRYESGQPWYGDLLAF